MKSSLLSQSFVWPYHSPSPPYADFVTLTSPYCTCTYSHVRKRSPTNLKIQNTKTQPLLSFSVWLTAGWIRCFSGLGQQTFKGKKGIIILLIIICLLIFYFISSLLHFLFTGSSHLLTACVISCQFFKSCAQSLHIIDNIHCTYLWLDVSQVYFASLSYLPIYLNPLCSYLLPSTLPLVSFFSCAWWFCHLQWCVMLNLSPAVAGACGEGRKKGGEEKWTEEWFVVPGSCSFGKRNGRWLFKVSPICHKRSLQMDTYNSSLPGWGAAVSQSSRQHLSVWMRMFVRFNVCACVSLCLFA